MALTMIAVIPFFSQDTLAYDAVLETKFGCEQISSLEDIAETVKF